MHYDAIVLGGGLYGCKVALALRASGVKKVLLVEPHDLVSGATRVNQNRVHGGYHYPRSIQTAASAQANYTRFIADHAPTIERNLMHLYGIAEGSLTMPAQFEKVMAEVGAPLQPVASDHRWTSKILQLYRVEEVVFNIEKMRSFLREQITQAGITIASAGGRIVDVDDRKVYVTLRDEAADFVVVEDATADYVFNCTYGRLADVGAQLKTRLQYEWCEVALFYVPRDTCARTMDITIMDGPFWSLMKYPGKDCHALTHVEHTVHARWFSDDPIKEMRTYTSAWEKMLDDATTYNVLVNRGNCRYIESLWTKRVVLADNEPDDGRPILWEHDPRSPRIVSVLGSKFNSVYDAVKMVEQGEWSARKHKLNVRREGRRVLVGYTGFVGQNLDVPGRFTDRVNSQNLGTLSGHYQQIVLAVPSGSKSWANANPDEDMDAILDLQKALYGCTADEVLMVSTIDVHNGHAGLYGEHRRFFEDVVRGHFENVKIVRLPALYGPGLAKNALYDMLCGQQPIAHPDSEYQWFDVRDTWKQFEGLKAGCSWDVLPAPISVRSLAEMVGFTLSDWPLKFTPVYYRRGPYNIDETEVRRGLREWIANGGAATIAWKA